MNPNILSPEAIMQAAPAPVTETVPVPEWGGSVVIKGFTRAEIKKLRQQATTVTMVNGQKTEDVDSDHLEELLFLEGLVEPKLDRSHWVELQNRAAGGIETVLKAITKASGLTKEEAADLRKSVPAGETDPVRV